MVMFHSFLYVYQRVIPGESGAGSPGIHRDSSWFIVITWIQGTLSAPMHALQPKQSIVFHVEVGMTPASWSWWFFLILRTSPGPPRNPDSSAWKKSVLPCPRWRFPSEATSNWSPENILAITRSPLKTTMISIISITCRDFVRIFIRIWPRPGTVNIGLELKTRCHGTEDVQGQRPSTWRLCSLLTVCGFWWFLYPCMWPKNCESEVNLKWKWKYTSDYGTTRDMKSPPSGGDRLILQEPSEAL